jgi:CHAD domain-containing protein
VARRHRWTPDLTAVIRGRLERERARRARSLHDKLSKSSRQALQDALRDSRARLERDDGDVDAALIGRVERRAGAVLEAVAHVGTLYADEPLHALRIAIKKLRYAAELLPPAAVPDLASLLKVLHDAQRRFGALRDRQTLAMHVQAIGEARCGAAMRAALATAAANLEQDCRRLHTRAVAVVPAVDAAAHEIRRMVNVPGRRRRFAMARAALTTPAVVRKPAAANS